ncbi:hypothetical protein [Azospirillum sp. TSO22-1]|uniref:hypothetical protein n=1 Tax=Azospirillum sp. TSO22-1 TaxID=716789 RepID=UPI000D6169A6|nr:hypothetical protein [Azospirillum sp. TSO22-1]PWC44276.1 hypothetical protein TSO221_18460 [Azospirillum sp. TSO22-1]
MRQNLKTHSGNRIAVELDGKVVGLVQSVMAKDNYGLQDAIGIGDIHVQEHIPTKADHALTVDTMVLFRGNLRDAGVAPQNGDDVLRGVVFDLCIYSKDTGQLLRKYIGCSYLSGELKVEAQKIVMNKGDFKALDVVGTAM